MREKEDFGGVRINEEIPVLFTIQIWTRQKIRGE